MRKFEQPFSVSPEFLRRYYLQNETELTRPTRVRILEDSGRLGEFFHNPQRFMDAVKAILKHELHRLLVDGSSIVIRKSLGRLEARPTVEQASCRRKKLF